MPETEKALLIIERLDTVGFVDSGANPDADVLIWKRVPDSHEKGGSDMPFDPKKDLSAEGQTWLEDLEKKQKEALDAAVAKNAKEFEALKAKVAELAEGEGDGDGEGEGEGEGEGDGALAKLRRLLLGENEPDPVTKGMTADQVAIHKAQEARIAKAEAEAKAATDIANTAIAKAAEERKERQMVEFRKIAETDLSLLQGEPDDKSILLYAVHNKLDKETAKSVVDMLRAANSQVQKAAEQLAKEIGSSGGDSDPESPWNQVLDKAKELRKSQPELYDTDAKAVAKILVDNPKLAVATRPAQTANADA